MVLGVVTTDSPEQARPSPGEALAIATAKDHAKIRERDAEHAHARKHCRLTRILGCLLVGGFVLQIVSAWSAGYVDLGGPVPLALGILVLRGSQGAVRFVAIIGVIGMLDLLVRLIWALVMAKPVEIDSGFYGYRDIVLWSGLILPAVYMFGEGIMAFVVLRHRGLRIWNKWLFWLFVIWGAFAVTGGSLRAIRDLKEREFLRRFPAEVRQAEDFVKTHGVSWPASMSQAARDVMASPSLHTVAVHEANSKGWILDGKDTPVSQEKTRRVTHWVKTASGKWYAIDLWFILPEDRS